MFDDERCSAEDIGGNLGGPCACSRCEAERYQDEQRWQVPPDDAGMALRGVAAQAMRERDSLAARVAELERELAVLNEEHDEVCRDRVLRFHERDVARAELAKVMERVGRLEMAFSDLADDICGMQPGGDENDAIKAISAHDLESRKLIGEWMPVVEAAKAWRIARHNLHNASERHEAQPEHHRDVTRTQDALMFALDAQGGES